MYKIYSFTRYGGTILADTTGKRYEISESDFENYLRRNFLLIDVMTCEGVQKEYTISMDEYWNTEIEFIKLDLETYLKMEQVKAQIEVKQATGYINTVFEDIFKSFKLC